MTNSFEIVYTTGRLKWCLKFDPWSARCREARSPRRIEEERRVVKF